MPEVAEKRAGGGRVGARRSGRSRHHRALPVTYNVAASDHPGCLGRSLSTRYGGGDDRHLSKGRECRRKTRRKQEAAFVEFTIPSASFPHLRLPLIRERRVAEEGFALKIPSDLALSAETWKCTDPPMARRSSAPPRALDRSTTCAHLDMHLGHGPRLNPRNSNGRRGVRIPSGSTVERCASACPAAIGRSEGARRLGGGGSGGSSVCTRGIGDGAVWRTMQTGLLGGLANGGAGRERPSPRAPLATSFRPDEASSPPPEPCNHHARRSHCNKSRPC
jgi:hypothetical protein